LIILASNADFFYSLFASHLSAHWLRDTEPVTVGGFSLLDRFIGKEDSGRGGDSTVKEYS
jgi:hypothetical protein